MTLTPLVYDIRRFALDDGPGIRSTVFMKGCPLRCVWCQNPESLSPEPQIAFHENLCVTCGQCEEVCPQGAIRLNREPRIRRQTCVACGTCAAGCPAAALELLGQPHAPEELAARLLADRIYYDTSGGGVTFSGGEPTMHMDYVARVAGLLAAEGIHVGLQTSGCFDLAEFEAKLLPVLDVVWFDLKLADSGEHRRFTGLTNRLILSNFRALAASEAIRLVATVPLVPGITATRRNLTRIGSILAEAQCRSFEVRPYHPGGIAKRRMIGGATPRGVPAMPLRWKEQQRFEKILASVGTVSE